MIALPIACPNCGGYGLREGFGGGPVECRACDGSGGFYVTRSDRLRVWPGGPFAGMWPGAFKDALARYARRLPA